MGDWTTEDEDVWVDFDPADYLKGTAVDPSLGVGGKRTGRYWLHPNGWTDVEVCFRWGTGASKGRGAWYLLLPDGLKADARLWWGTSEDDNWRILKGATVLGRTVPSPIGQHNGLTTHLYDEGQRKVGWVVEGGMFLAAHHPFGASEALGNLHCNFSFVRQPA